MCLESQNKGPNYKKVKCRMLVPFFFFETIECQYLDDKNKRYETKKNKKRENVATKVKKKHIFLYYINLKNLTLHVTYYFIIIIVI